MDKTVFRSLALLVLAAIAGCASDGTPIERLDAGTGVTWRAAGRAAVFARTDPRYSRSARDYLYLGPVETNTRGLREYYLWVGIASTLDRGFLAPERPLPVALTLLIGGEPVDLDLQPWPGVVGTAARLAPYDPPVTPQLQLGARITASLLERIRAEGIDGLRARLADETAQPYFFWEPLPAWTGFFDGNGAR